MKIETSDPSISKTFTQCLHCCRQIEKTCCWNKLDFEESHCRGKKDFLCHAFTLEPSSFRMPFALSTFCPYTEPRYLHQSILKGRDLSFRTAFCQFWTTAAAETAVAVPRDISSSGSIVSPSKTSGPSSGALRYPNFSPDTDKQFLCFCPKRTYRNLE